MEKYVKSTVHDHIFSTQELEKLIKWFNQVPEADNQGIDPKGNINKHLNYDLPISPVHQIIKPKINELIGPDHIFNSGAYKELRHPYATHIDNTYFISLAIGELTQNKKYEAAVLIPLVEHEKFNTVIFDIDDDKINLPMGGEMPQSWLTVEDNGLDLDDFDHINEPTRSQVKKLPVDFVAKWKLGSLIVWRRNQLHASTNFAKFGLIKKFIIVFIS
jgi:hypothetical protein